MGSTSGLSSVLGDLARGKRRKPARGQRPPISPIPDEELTDARIEAGARMRSAADPHQRMRVVRVKRQQPVDPRMRRLAAAALAVVGLAMLVPAVWAAGVLAGYEPWRMDRPDAHAMAVAMLICWPIGFGLLATSVMTLRGARRAEARRLLAKRAEARRRAS